MNGSDDGRSNGDRGRNTRRGWFRIVTGLLLVLLILPLGERLSLGQSRDNALYIDSEGRVGVGKTNPQAALDVDGAVKATSFEGIGAVPRGAILMWSGAQNELPPGWALCNGENGTPDLRDRFVLAAGDKYAVGSPPGGAETYTLTIDQMPPHDHQGKTTEDGKHSHIVGVRIEDPRYLSPRMDKYNRPPLAPGADQAPAVVLGGEFRDEDFLWDMGKRSTSVLAFRSAEDPGHQHAITKQGGGQDYQVMPPYYALAFIMKVQ